ncbi:MAG: DUF1549 and DUF1553 domain-containing protein [Verrucomicrobiota bacterium]|nr:DUF1549 and DUF1553 domain-containing protein [Verrucomicrobiota bacterium]
MSRNRFSHALATGIPLLVYFGLLPALAPANALKAAASKEPAPKTSAANRTAAARWTNLATAEEPSFRRHVVPLMSRLGCSGRECHGSASGQGGFQLSLFGYDFDKDHKEITADSEDGIRIETDDPARSLILAKPALDGEKHKGKKRFEKGSWEYNLLLKWIVSGAKLDVAETGEFARLEVLPKELVFKKAGEVVQLKVLAHWKDGAVEDVTQLTRFRTNDESVALVSDAGLVTSKDKGDTHVVAFYDNGVEPIAAMLPMSSQFGDQFPKVKARTKVDALVLQKLKKMGIVPSELVTDAEFLRRASLDVTGTLPAPAEIEAFLADKSANKRSKKIDELLARPAYAAWWTTKFCDFTGNSGRNLNNVINAGRNMTGQMSRQWYDWIYKRVADNTPYDQLAAGIILATGRTSPEQSYKDFALEMGSYFRRENPVDFATRPNLPYYWQRRNLQKAEDKALAFAHTFLGVRIECAQCHKHPFDQWTKTDFEQFQAFFTAITTGNRQPPKGKDAPPTEEVTYASLSKEIKEKAAAALAFKTLDPKKNNDQKAQQAEMTRRLEAGEPLPWTELYADMRRAAQPGKEGQKNKAQGSSRVITPKILGGEKVMLQQYNDPREPLMAWVRDKENPYFAKAFVNRLWASYFHRGIVEPADDLNLANAPVNAALLDYLTDGFVARRYDMKWLHREILNSDTYQRSWKTNATNKLDEKNFSHAVIRRLPAEVAFDAITMATTNSARAATFASDLADRAIGPTGNSGQGGGTDGYALTLFGKPARETNCDCERTTDPTLLQTIYTRNDPTLLGRIEGQKNGWLSEVRKIAAPSPETDPAAIRQKLQREEEKFAQLKKPASPSTEDPEAQEKYQREIRRYDERVSEAKTRLNEMKRALAEAEKPRPEFRVETVIREVFLRTVSRPPTEAEFAQAKADVAAAKSPVEGVRDLLWAMLNTREFMVNH